MTNNRRNIYLDDDLAEYVDEYEIPLSELAQEAVEDHQIRNKGQTERLKRQIREKEDKISQKETEIDKLESELADLRERLEQVEEEQEFAKQKTKSILDDLVNVPPEAREKRVKATDTPIPTATVVDIADSIDLHYVQDSVSSGTPDVDDVERIREAATDAGYEWDSFTWADDEDLVAFVRGLLPAEEKAFEEEWERRFGGSSDGGGS